MLAVQHDYAAADGHPVSQRGDACQSETVSLDCCWPTLRHWEKTVLALLVVGFVSWPVRFFGFPAKEQPTIFGIPSHRPKPLRVTNNGCTPLVPFSTR